MKTKTIIINGRFLTQPITGVQRYGIELVHAIDELLSTDHEVVKGLKFRLLTPKIVRHTPHLKCINLTPCGVSAGHFWEQFELPRFAHNGLLFCPGNTAPLYNFYRKNVVVCVHSLAYHFQPEAYSKTFRMWYKFLMKLIFRHARRIITVSNSERNAMLSIFSNCQIPIEVVQNGGISREFHKKLQFTESTSFNPTKPYFLFVGSMSKVKNLENVISALTLLQTRFPDIKLYVVGAKSDSFSEISLSLPATAKNNIRFLGQVDDTQTLISLYRGASALVFPSFYEASPLPPLEAMSCGCPVIASDIPALRERCDDAAIYCDPANPHSIADCMNQILSSPVLRAQLQAKGRERAQQFSWQKCAIETITILRKSLHELNL